jgi:hypothetical protein
MACGLRKSDHWLLLGLSAIAPKLFDIQAWRLSSQVGASGASSFYALALCPASMRE